MPSFICPCCKETELKVLPQIVCPKCRTYMKASPLTGIEHRSFFSKDKGFFAGSDTEKSVIGFLANDSPDLYRSTLYAIFPAQGIALRSPFLVVSSDQEFIQPHPQLETPFTRFFIKGMLYSAILNIIPFALFNPPIILFWIFTFAFAGIYYYYSRQIPAKGTIARQLILAQTQTDTSRHATN